MTMIIKWSNKWNLPQSQQMLSKHEFPFSPRTSFLKSPQNIFSLIGSILIVQMRKSRFLRVHKTKFLTWLLSSNIMSLNPEEKEKASSKTKTFFFPNSRKNYWNCSGQLENPHSLEVVRITTCFSQSDSSSLLSLLQL